jgi:hypothetical protein
MIMVLHQIQLPVSEIPLRHSLRKFRIKGRCHAKQLKILEPATGIEPATCGLRIVPDPHTDNLTPQETTKQDTPDVGTDGAGLSCPGSSVVADEEIRN